MILITSLAHGHNKICMYIYIYKELLFKIINHMKEKTCQKR